VVGKLEIHGGIEKRESDETIKSFENNNKVLKGWGSALKFPRKNCHERLLRI
jgi:hypothetical protein